jgi:hypothetical protein
VVTGVETIFGGWLTHESPLFAGGFEQMPVAGSQTPA